MPKKEAKALELPRFTAARSVDYPAWATVRCPREECGEMFLVKIASWLKPLRYVSRVGNQPTVTITARACPYCFKAARIPARSAIR